MDTPSERKDEDRPEGADASPATPARQDVPTTGTNRVLDQGTSQELVIINYADDALLSARSGPRAPRETRETHEPDGDRLLELDDGGAPARPPRADAPGRVEPRPDAAADGPEAGEAEAAAGEPARPADPDNSLVIVRDADFVMMGMDAAVAPRPPVAPPPAPRPVAPPPPAPRMEAPPPPPPARPEPEEEKGPRFFEPGAADPGARRPVSRRAASSMPRQPSSAGAGVAAGVAAAAPRQPSGSGIVRPRPVSGAGVAIPPAEAKARAEADAAPAARENTIWSRAPRMSWVALFAGIAAFAGGTALSVLRVEPFHTWYYLFAWYPFLLVVNHLTAMRAGDLSVFAGRARPLAALAAWSVPVWLAFEVLNFRLENWYYVGVPHAWIARRLGVILSFATVLPGIFLVEELLRHRNLFKFARSKPFPLDARTSRRLFRIGLAGTALVLALPTFLFPFVWILPVLLLEPWLARRGAPSLLAELAAGRPGRTYRLLLAGLLCGLFWEAANSIAGGRWIYTVPGLPSGKLFEMPVPGFLGFAPFALACASMARALATLGLLPEWEVMRPRQARAAKRAEEAAAARAASGEVPAPEAAPAPPAETPAPEAKAPAMTGARLSLCAWAVLASFLVLEGMDRWTIDSRRARPEDVPGIPDGVAQYAHRHGKDDVRGLVELIEAGALHVPGASSQAQIAALRDRCRLILLRGIGPDNARRLDAVGVTSIEELAARDPAALAKALRGIESGWWPRPRRVAVWVEAAREATR